MSPDEFAEAVIASIHTALAPLLARVAALETKTAAPSELIINLNHENALLRERIAVLETRAPIPGPPGIHGKDGADGLGFEDLSVDHDGERGVTFRWSRGDKVKEVAVAFPCLLYRGIYSVGTAYQPGDIVTHNGSSWHCQKATATRPETFEGAAFWKLMVKRGDKGRDLRLVDPAAPAPVVRAR
jgi:Carbohydrate-binding module family 5/12